MTTSDVKSRKSEISPRKIRAGTVFKTGRRKILEEHSGGSLQGASGSGGGKNSERGVSSFYMFGRKMIRGIK